MDYTVVTSLTTKGKGTTTLLSGVLCEFDNSSDINEVVR